MTDINEFKNVLIAAGIPVTEEEIQQVWESIVKEQGFEVNNNSPFSPFWRLIKAIASKPALQITDLLTQSTMPNSFVLSATGQWLDKHGASRNTPRLDALKTVGNVQFTRASSAGELIIPAGTIIESSPINNITYQVATLYDTTFDDGETLQVAVVEATKEGGDHNLTAGYYNSLLVPIEWVSVVNLENWIISAGQEIESDENYRLRIRDKFATLGNFHVDAVYRAIISEFPGILANNIEFDKDTPRGPGSVNAYVHLNVGNISPAVIDEVNNHIASGYHGHGDDMLVFAMPTQEQDIVVQYWLAPNEDDINNELSECIRAAFRENSAFNVTTCYANSTFSFSLLASEIHQLFPQISSIKFTNSDIEAGLWLPVIDTLTVTNMS